MRDPDRPGVPPRSVRVEDALWDAAKAKAEEKNVSLSDIMRAALVRFLRRP